jgi:hypothetical protein
MITKIQLVEIIQKRLAGQLSEEQAGAFDSQMVAKYIGRAFNTLMWEIFRGGLYNMDNYTKRYSSVTVTYDSTQEIYTSTLPEDIVQLPRIGSGVMKIQTITGTGVNFAPASNQEFDLLDGTEVDLIDSTIRFNVRSQTIEYKNMTSAIASVGVKMDLVIPFDSYDWDDTVMIPAGQDQRLIELVVGFAMGQPIDDQLNNNQLDNRMAVVPK